MPPFPGAYSSFHKKSSQLPIFLACRKALLIQLIRSFDEKQTLQKAAFHAPQVRRMMYETSFSGKAAEKVQRVRVADSIKILFLWNHSITASLLAALFGNLGRIFSCWLF